MCGWCCQGSIIGRNYTIVLTPFSLIFNTVDGSLFLSCVCWHGRLPTTVHPDWKYKHLCRYQHPSAAVLLLIKQYWIIFYMVQLPGKRTPCQWHLFGQYLRDCGDYLCYQDIAGGAIICVEQSSD